MFTAKSNPALGRRRGRVDSGKVMRALTSEATLEEWQKAGRSFDHDGTSVFYRDEGKGDALLCLHGFPTASWDWARLWPLLTRGFRMIAPDMIGFGFSDKPADRDYTIGGQTDMIEALMAKLGVSRVHILAHDYGDTVAQELLARQLERGGPGGGLELASVCLLNGGLFPEATRPMLIQRLLAGPLGKVVGQLANPGVFKASLASVFAPQLRPPAAEFDGYWRLFSNKGGTRVAHRLIGYMGERRRHRERWVGALRDAAVPVRLVIGAVDRISGPGVAERYAEIVPDADIVRLPRVGHYPQIEDTGGVLAAFLAFHGERVGRASGGAQ